MRISRLLVCAVLAQAAINSGAQTKRALLIGINTYQPTNTLAIHPQGCTYGRCDLTSFDNLEGPLNDVVAVRDLLTSPKFGFPVDKVVAVTDPLLPASPLQYVNLGSSQTTHDGILAVMQKYLVDDPQPGDTVVFYYAGHGSLRVNSKGTKLSLAVEGHVTHADSTIVPSDAWTGAFDVRDREMTHVFNAALDKGIKLTVILDSCYSGALTRGIKLNERQPRKRWVPYDPRDINQGPDLLPNGNPRPAPAERVDNPALIFSAAQQDQSAQEMPPPDDIPIPHGAFTVALIKALEVLPANTSTSTVYMRVKAYMEGSGIEDQTPSLDAGPTRRAQSLFGGTAENGGKVRAAAVTTDSDGNIVLDAGKLAGIGPNSEFTSLVADNRGRKVVIRVTDLDGIVRSKAAVVSPIGAGVSPGQVFELTKWVPAPSDPLHFWTSPANLSQENLRGAIDQIKASGVSWVEDPVEQVWTDVLSWNGNSWILQHAGSSSPMPIGSTVTAEGLKTNLHSDAKLWANLPPPKDLAAKLELRTPESAVQGVSDVSNSDYILAGSLNAKGAAWAWLHKAELSKGPSSQGSTNHSPGCSASSRYPVRTNWVIVNDLDSVASGAATLNKYASRLAKIHGWINLASSPTGASSENYYTLAFTRLDNQQILRDGDSVHAGDRLKMVLTSSDAVTEKRWVYVLDINCQGQGNLLYPIEFSENQFPNDADNGLQIELRGSKAVQVGSPFGLDTVILISTSQPLPDPYALNFEGVTARKVGEAQSPLQQLLSKTSRGTRGLESEIPTDWGISMGSLQSVPKAEPQ
jgi:hypothetical protein